MFARADAGFVEEDHPRGPDGKFGKGGGVAAAPAAKPKSNYKPASYAGMPAKAPAAATPSKTQIWYPGAPLLSGGSYKPAGSGGGWSKSEPKPLSEAEKAALAAKYEAEKAARAAHFKGKISKLLTKMGIPLSSHEQVTYQASKSLPSAPLNGIEFSHYREPNRWNEVEGQNSLMTEPPLPELEQDQRLASGIIIMEPDGRIWLTKPKGGFGGYDYSFPKGGVDEGLSPQANSIKEAFEETGLKAKITGYHGDYEGDTSVSRYYLGEREGGSPTDAGWESEAVVLATLEQAAGLLNRTRDKQILLDLVKRSK